MPVTRSASQAATASLQQNISEMPPPPVPAKVENGKRKAVGANPTPKAPKKKARASEPEVPTSGSTDVDSAGTSTAPGVQLNAVPRDDTPPVFVPAELTFSFEDAKRHLINVDQRFEEIFRRLQCRPYEKLERLDPFHTLADSIVGQQISWRAARSIKHRFIRLFDPSIPEKHEDYSGSFFPTPRQVVFMDVPTLRTAGLSGRKAEYVLDLAARFADGRLSTEKLLQAEDEELYELLTSVRGIGRWTVDMFAIFSLRRPDILPVGDLGVQRGVLRWFLSLHSPSFNVMISPDKLALVRAEEPESSQKGKAVNSEDNDTLPVLGMSSGQVANDELEEDDTLFQDISSVIPAVTLPKTPAVRRKGKGKKANGEDSDDEEAEGVLPTPFTPSINQTLNMQAQLAKLGQVPAPLPEGLTVAMLKSRLDSKKKIKGAILTPKEMEDLTAPWRPYRSLAVYYMWALAEEPK